MPTKRYTGANLSPRKTADILQLLCEGKTINQAAKATGSNWFTVRNVQWRNSSTVEEHKRLLAERAESAAADALDVLHHKVLTNGHNMRPAELVPIFGVCIDKSLALRGDPGLVVQHSHEHIHAHISEDSYIDLLSKLPRRSQLDNSIIDVDPSQSP